MKYLVYQIKNIHNDKIYIGKHITENELDNYMGSGKIVSRAIKKYGAESFSKEILEYCSAESLNEREIFWIKNNNSLQPNGYNIALGGEGGDTFTFNPISEKTREKIANSHLGKHHNEKTKEKIAKSLEGKRLGINHPMFGKVSAFKNHTHSTESIDKMKKIKEHIPEKSRDKMSQSAKKLKECPHCHKITNVGNYNRWHNNNCRFK
jgi:group I intron endonuclease